MFTPLLSPLLCHPGWTPPCKWVPLLFPWLCVCDFSLNLIRDWLAGGVATAKLSVFCSPLPCALCGAFVHCLYTHPFRNHWRCPFPSYSHSRLLLINSVLARAQRTSAPKAFNALWFSTHGGCESRPDVLVPVVRLGPRVSTNTRVRLLYWRAGSIHMLPK